jgi:hypothetical protein
MNGNPPDCGNATRLEATPVGRTPMIRHDRKDLP